MNMYGCTPSKTVQSSNKIYSAVIERIIDTNISAIKHHLVKNQSRILKQQSSQLMSIQQSSPQVKRISTTVAVQRQVIMCDKSFFDPCKTSPCTRIRTLWYQHPLQ